MAARVVVRGHVQGVFFRVSMTDLAQSAGIDAVLAWVRAGGPPAARVADLEVHEVPDEDATSFGVRR